MALDKNGNLIQAPEVNETSEVGIVANKGGEGSIVHLLADGDVTFHFKSGDKKLTGMKGGSDFVAGKGCTGITSTAAIILS